MGVRDAEPLDRHGSLRQQVIMHNGRMHTLNWLIDRLWNRKDTMPAFLCEQLAVPSGSTYAQGERPGISLVIRVVAIPPLQYPRPGTPPQSNLEKGPLCRTSRACDNR